MKFFYVFLVCLLAAYVGSKPVLAQKNDAETGEANRIIEMQKVIRKINAVEEVFRQKKIEVQNAMDKAVQSIGAITTPSKIKDVKTPFEAKLKSLQQQEANEIELLEKQLRDLQVGPQSSL